MVLMLLQIKGRTAMPELMILLMFSTALPTPLPRYLDASGLYTPQVFYPERMAGWQQPGLLAQEQGSKLYGSMPCDSHTLVAISELDRLVDPC